MFRIVRVPVPLDTFFHGRRPRFHGDPCESFRLRVLAIACAWGRRHVANLYQSLDVPHHRTRFNTFCLVQRWAPEAALRQQAQRRRRTVHPQGGATRDRIMDESKKAKRGTAMAAVAKRKAPTLDAYIWGHQDGWGLLVFRQHVSPYGIRLDGNKAPGPALGLPFRTTPARAAQLIRALHPPAGVKVMVLFEAYYWCRPVVKACREQGVHFAATLKSHRRLCKQGWQRKAGRYGRTLLRRRRTAPLILAKPQGQPRSRLGDAGWLQVSHLGPLPLVCSRQGTARNILGLGPDDAERSAAGRIRTDEKRWVVEPFFKDRQPLLGLGPYQHRPYWAAVTHLPLVCFASALLTPLRIARDGAPGQWTRKKAADVSTAAAQDQLRRRLWEDLRTYVREKPHGQPVLEELERLRVA